MRTLLRGAAAALLALPLLYLGGGGGPAVLTAIGLGVVVVGVYIVANVWKEPHYKVILAWDPEAMPANWEAGRRRYFTINWIQLATTWSAFALYLVAHRGYRSGRPLTWASVPSSLL
jgi:hypothetical protein